MTQHLLAIHIGPMQSFIAAARRTRDLWFGSWLMSELSKAAAQAIADVEVADVDEVQLIFPAAKKADLAPDSDLNVANRLVAILPAGADVKKVAKQARKAMKARLKELGKEALQDVKSPLGDNYKYAMKQIIDLPEFYWVTVPLLSAEHYREARATADALLAARKNTRNFAPVGDWAGARPKSSLDGLRESVIPKKFYASYQASQEKKDKKRQRMYSLFRARPAEQLSGVDLLKRKGAIRKVENRFPSTSHMAATPFLQGLRESDSIDELKTLWESYYQTLEQEIKDDEQVSRKLFGNHPVLGNADGSLLYESRLIEYYEKEIPSDVKTALQAFYDHKDVPQPLTYYAILVGDGDNMGKTLEKLATPEAHQGFSRTLAGFASEARTIVERYGGAAIFTGGDDVVALLPLDTAVECAAELAKTFHDTMASIAPSGVEPTFSAGIAIFHHIEPLEDGLALARRAEKIAKDVPGKNALAIALDKRGGAERTAVGKWGHLDKNLKDLTNFYRDRLPKGFAYHLRDAYLELGGASSQMPDVTIILQKEAERILKRRGLSDEMQEKVAKMLGEVDHQTYTLEMFSHELVIANLLAQAQEQANLSAKKEEANA